MNYFVNYFHLNLSTSNCTLRLKYLPEGFVVKRQTDLPSISTTAWFSPVSLGITTTCRNAAGLGWEQTLNVSDAACIKETASARSSRGRLWPQSLGKQPHRASVSVQAHNAAHILAEGSDHLPLNLGFTGQACVQIWEIISYPSLLKVKMPPGFVCFLFFSPRNCQKVKAILTHRKPQNVSLGLFANLDRQKSHKVKNKIFTYLFIHHLISKHLLCASHCAGLTAPVLKHSVSYRQHHFSPVSWLAAGFPTGLNYTLY